MSMKRKIAAGVGAMALVYIFVPDPTDVVPFIGWIDEGVAGAILLWSMRTLGVTPSSIMQKLRGRAPTAALEA